VWSKSFRALRTDVRVECDHPDVSAMVGALVETYGPPKGEEKLVYRLETGPGNRLWRNEDLVCRPEETIDLAPAFEGDLYRVSLEDCREGHAAFHGAALTWGDDAIMLCGPSGSGKSTLAMALVERGAGYLTDECVLLDSQSRVLGLTRPISFGEGECNQPIPPGARVSEYPIRKHNGRVRLHQLVHPPTSRLSRGTSFLRRAFVLHHDKRASPARSLLSKVDALASVWASCMIDGKKPMELAMDLVQHIPVYDLTTRDVVTACKHILDTNRSP
jgi:hypothetical protein